ncbi:hypothetical protein KFE25_006348 [Diacronema lutheri]|uniref:GST C-terminal domain-containing protein n=1 Tax=Diacronema lutheri TaxID=2081491 RepID=A0A8J5XKS1_DIALT|nr:hypothetical protein KFE25_006348 [Diacronema lutheri]
MAGQGKPLRLFYHPGLPGRGEFVRMVLEEGGVPYIDVVRDEGYPPAEMHKRCAAFSPPPEPPTAMRPFAPPFIELPDGTLISQTANLLMLAGTKGGLAPTDELGRLKLMGLLLTIADVCTEAHDTHHPISIALYFEDQKSEALAKAKWFTGRRMGQVIGYMHETLRANGGPWLLGTECSAADIALLQLCLGLEFAFPRAYAKAMADRPALRELLERVRARPRLAAYLASQRRSHFNKHGIFRDYKELDVVGDGGDEEKRAA